MKLEYGADGFLLLDSDPFPSAVFKQKPAFRIQVRRYVEEELPDGRFLLKSQETAEDSRMMIRRLSSVAERLDVQLDIEQEVLDAIEAKREYAEERARVGVEIKCRDEKFADWFAEYSDIVNDAMQRPLRERQMWDSFFMCAMGKAGNFSVPGSGKTASVLGVFAYLEQRGLANRIVVICPKNAFESWRNEFLVCFGDKLRLREFNVQNCFFATLPRAERKRRLRAESGGCNLILVNYEASIAYVEELRAIVSEASLLVFDEVHRVKKINGKWASAALEIASVSERTIALTGTPIPNTYLDIYNFLNILFPLEYKEFFNFSPAMLRDPSEYEIAHINSKLQPFFCRTTKDDLGVPAAQPNCIKELYVDDETEHVLDVLKMRYKKNALTLMLRVLQLETDPIQLLSTLDTSEYAWLLDEDEETGAIDYVDYSDEIEGMIRRCPPSIKVDECVSLVSQLAAEGKPVIVWCIFIRSMLLLRQRLSAAGIQCAVVHGETSQEDRELVLDAFRAGGFPVLITNPHTLAESVSLHSVCHDAIYYEYSFNLVHLLQSKDRIHRLGLPDGQYTQYYFLQDVYDNFNDAYSLDANIYNRLLEKEETMLRAIADQELETLPSTEEDLAAIFEGLFD